MYAADLALPPVSKWQMHTEDARTKGPIPMTCIMEIQVAAAILDKGSYQKVPKMEGILQTEDQRNTAPHGQTGEPPLTSISEIHGVIDPAGNTPEEAQTIRWTVTCAYQGFYGLV
ncbi:Hypothetical predicted protein, partial [Pelobates cultripes]